MRNRLYDALPRDVRGQLDDLAEHVTLKRGHILHEPSENIRDLYFPLNALVSITITIGDGRIAETGVVGTRPLYVALAQERDETVPRPGRR